MTLTMIGIRTTANAAYDRKKAASYAQKYASEYNSIYYRFNSDCTNFVSQCEAVAGVVSIVSSKLPSAPSWFSDTKLDNNPNSWYMIYKPRKGLAKDYYLYSRTWSMVTDFRNYFKKNNYSRSNAIANVKEVLTENWSNSIKKLKVGDVLQYDTGDYRHSVIISQNGINGIRYCSHTQNRKNQLISSFYDYLKKHNIKSFYVISFAG